MLAPNELIMEEWVGDMRARDAVYSSCFDLVIELLLGLFTRSPHAGSAFEDLLVGLEEVLLEGVMCGFVCLTSDFGLGHGDSVGGLDFFRDHGGGCGGLHAQCSRGS